MVIRHTTVPSLDETQNFGPWGSTGHRTCVEFFLINQLTTKTN
jgi:hypothetical protein